MSTTNPPSFSSATLEQSSNRCANYKLQRLIDAAGLEVRTCPIRASAMHCWQTCKRKFLFQERMGLQRFTYVSALEIGALYHKIMDALMSGAKPERASEIGAAAVEAFREELLKRSSKDGLQPDGRATTEVLQKATSDLQLARAMALAYWALVPWDLERYEVVESEKLYTVRYGTLVPLRCRVDQLIRDRKSGEHWIFDSKTIGKGKSRIARVETVRQEFQPQLYRLVMAVARPELSIVGFIHSVATKPTIKFCGKDASFEAYVERVAKSYREMHAKNPQDPPFVRSFIRFPQPLMSPEFETQIQEINRACRAKPDLSPYYRDPSGEACYKYGKTPCPYRALCSTDPEGWEPLLKGFVQEFRDDEAEEAGEQDD